MASGKIKRYAVDLLNEIRFDVEEGNRSNLPAIDFADVVQVSPILQITPHGQDIIYDGDDLMYQIDPDSISLDDVLVIGRDSTQQPVVLGIADGNNEDPFLDPDAAALRDSFLELQAAASTWQAPVATATSLPNSGNVDGDVRLVFDEDALYRWDADLNSWTIISGGAVIGDFVDTTGDTMTGDLVMDTGTVVTLTDGPTNPTDATNKDYVDTAIAGVSVGATVPVTTVAGNYAVSGTDRVILVDSTGGTVFITLPASHSVGRIYEVKDWKGTAATNNITVQTADSDTIDGSATMVLTTNYQSATFVSDGTNWSII